MEWHLTPVSSSTWSMAAVVLSRPLPVQQARDRCDHQQQQLQVRSKQLQLSHAKLSPVWTAKVKACNSNPALLRFVALPSLAPPPAGARCCGMKGTSAQSRQRVRREPCNPPQTNSEHKRCVRVWRASTVSSLLGCFHPVLLS